MSILSMLRMLPPARDLLVQVSKSAHYPEFEIFLIAIAPMLLFDERNNVLTDLHKD